MATPSPTRGSGFWFIIIAVAIIIVGGIWWVSGNRNTGVGRDLDPATATPMSSEVAPGDPEPTLSAPPPTPNSPVATGTAGVPSGTAGAAPKPGDPTEGVTTD